MTERRVYETLSMMSRAAAEETCRLLSGALTARGRASLVLTGGRTPRLLYELLASDHKTSVQWKRIDFFWGDERYVPPESETSNFRLAQETLLKPLGIPSEHIHPMPTSFEDPLNAATAYEATLQQVFGKNVPSFDIVLLGMGVDGHVASLFPGSPALKEQRQLVAKTESPVPPSTRLSLTFPALNAADEIIMLVAGKEKRKALSEASHPSKEPFLPAAQVRGRKRTVWFLDREAAGTKGSSEE